MQQSLAFLVRNKSALIFYSVLISLLFVHSMDARSQAEYTSPTTVLEYVFRATGQTRGQCVNNQLYTLSELSGCFSDWVTYLDSQEHDKQYSSGAVYYEGSPSYKVYGEYTISGEAGSDPYHAKVALADSTAGLQEERSGDCPASYVPTGSIVPGYECEIDSDGDGVGDASSDPPYQCDDGSLSQTGISGCDTVDTGDDGLGFNCYDGSFAISAAECPEFTGDETNPSLEPNGVCEGNNYSQFSTDPDCNAPVPSPCPENTVCDADSTDPNADHDGDGVSNSNDADADSDGDGIPNGIDTDADGDGIPNHQDGDYSGFTGQGGTWVDSDGDGFHDGYQDGTGDGEGEGEGEEESEEPTTGNSSGSCDSPPQCSDDSVDCAILRQAWENLCPNVEQGELGGLTDEESAVTIENSIDRFTFRVQNTPIVAGLTNYFTLPPGAGCPTWSVSTGWVDITIDQFCSESIPWSIIYGIMIASASFGAAMIAFSGRGG